MVHADALSTSSNPEARFPAPAWLWPRRIPQRALTLLAGGVGAGKSFLACDLAARISRGAPWPDHQHESPLPQRVLLLTHEITTGYAQFRLQAAQADFRNLEFEIPPESGAANGAGTAGTTADETPPLFHLYRDLGRLEAFLEARRDIRVVVIDSLTWFLGSDGPAKLRVSVTRLADLARRKNLAIIATIAYRGVPRENRELRALGDQVVVTQPQVIWSVDQPDIVPTSERLLRPLKLSQLHDVAPLRFSLISGAVDWNQFTGAAQSLIPLDASRADTTNLGLRESAVQPLPPVQQTPGSTIAEQTSRQSSTVIAKPKTRDKTFPKTVENSRTSVPRVDRRIDRSHPPNERSPPKDPARGTAGGPPQRGRSAGASALPATGPPRAQTRSTSRSASSSPR